MDKGNVAIYGFIEANMSGKTLRTDEIAYVLDDGGLEGRYSDEMFFSGVAMGVDWFQFDMTTISREKVYLMDRESGERIETRKDFTGVSVFHYEIAERKSTSGLTGIMRLLSSTVKDHTMAGICYGVHDFGLKGNELSWSEDQLLYRDMPTGPGAYKPVAFSSRIRVFLEGGKLRFEYVPSYYEVDVATLERKASGDKYPVFLSREP